MILVIVVILSIGICGCTTTPPNEHLQETLLTISVGSQLYNYTLTNFTELSNITRQGSYTNKAGKITRPDNYTGVTIYILLNSIPNLPNNYTFHAIASDDYVRNYTSDELNGHVSVLNETGVEIETGNLIMIIAYEENEIVLNKLQMVHYE